MEENLTVTVSDRIDENTRSDLESRLRSILSRHGAISTGNQYGAGCAEYFFAVDPKRMNALQRSFLNDPIIRNLQEYVTVEFDE